VIAVPNCRNCGSFVTQRYVRVFTPDDLDQPRVCPDCEGKVRDNGKPREARASREGGNDPTEYDPAKDPTVTDGGRDD